MLKLKLTTWRYVKRATRRKKSERLSQTAYERSIHYVSVRPHEQDAHTTLQVVG